MEITDTDAGGTWRLCDGEGLRGEALQSPSERVISSPMGSSSAENIWTAASDGDIERILVLLTQDPDRINSKDENGYTPLHAATSYGCMDVVELLLGTGADVNIRDIDGDTPLHFCERSDIAKLILLAGADMFAVNNNGDSVLDKCLEDENHEMVSFWMQQGVSSKKNRNNKRSWL